MMRDLKILNTEIKAEVPSEISKIFYLNDSEIVELEMPLIIDIRKILSDKIIVTTRSIYPVGKYVNLDLVISQIKYSLIGKIMSFRIYEKLFYEITIMLEEIPESLLLEVEAFYIEK